MSLQINFPKARKYYFWAAFLSYLVSIDNASSDADRKLFGTLAYRMLSKAADSVPSDPVCSTSELASNYPFSPIRSRHFFLSIHDSDVYPRYRNNY